MELNKIYSGFRLDRIERIDEINGTAYEMKHEKALEVSSKSEVRVGKEIGAFSLEFYGNTGRFLGARRQSL